MRPGESANDDTQRKVRRLKAADLRADGKSYREIAVLLKVDLHTAWDDVAHVWGEKQRLKGEALEQARSRDVGILERCIAGLADLAESGDAPAAQAIRGLVSEKAKLQGTYAPTKVEKVPEQPLPDDELAAKLKEALATVEQRLADGKEARH